MVARTDYQLRRLLTVEAVIGQPSGCLEWQRCKEKGYGRLRHDGRAWLAHRLAWTLANGPIPDGLDVCHRCDNPSCVNANHLFLGTAQDNAIDMTQKGRHGRAGGAGERNGHAKLTRDDVIAVRAAYNAGKVTMAKLGARFNVNPSTIGYIVRGDTWSS